MVGGDAFPGAAKEWSAPGGNECRSAAAYLKSIWSSKPLQVISFID